MKTAKKEKRKYTKTPRWKTSEAKNPGVSTDTEYSSLVELLKDVNEKLRSGSVDDITISRIRKD